MTSEKSIKTAWLLSLSGFIPFGAFALALLFLTDDHPQYDLATKGMMTYGAVILSFLGGTRWGLALKGDGDAAAVGFVASVVPSLVGWFSLLLPVPYVFGVLAFAFVGQGAWDIISGRTGTIEPWFVKLRMTLTVLVCSSLAVAYLATMP